MTINCGDESEIRKFCSHFLVKRRVTYQNCNNLGRVKTVILDDIAGLPFKLEKLLFAFYNQSSEVAEPVHVLKNAVHAFIVAVDGS